ncbi:hypothetical protein LNO81_25865 [Klebsiella variicola subsp. variicola]|nr:hypothetical protein [Klebsiella variicola subsp. variicola]
MMIITNVKMAATLPAGTKYIAINSTASSAIDSLEALHFIDVLKYELATAWLPPLRSQRGGQQQAAKIRAPHNVIDVVERGTAFEQHGDRRFTTFSANKMRQSLFASRVFRSSRMLL